MGAGRQAQQIFRVIDTKRSALACTFGPLMQPTVISWLLAPRGVPNFFGIGGEMLFVWVNSHDSILRPLLRPPAGTSCDLCRTRRMQAPETSPSRKCTSINLDNCCTKQYRATSSSLVVCGRWSAVWRLSSLFQTSGHAVADNYDM
jgi:hypothetical protein